MCASIFERLSSRRTPQCSSPLSSDHPSLFLLSFIINARAGAIRSLTLYPAVIQCLSN